jgi:hypothetical protein
VVDWQCEVHGPGIVGIELNSQVTGVSDYGNGRTLPELIGCVVGIAASDYYNVLSCH